MKNLTVLFLLSVSLLSFGQERFNNIYENELYPSINNVFQVSDTGYVSVGGALFNYFLNIDVNYYDTMGNHVWNKHFGDEEHHYYHGSENACIKTEGGYILAGSSPDFNDTNMIYIVKFNEQFDTLWTRTFFKDTLFVAARGICNTDDGGFVVIGETELKSDSTIGNGHNYGLMLKLDTDGNYEWFKSFGTDNYDEFFYKVAQTHDGGYLVGGSTHSWQEPLWHPDLGDWYLVKTDANGNEEWYRRYGSPEYDDGRIGDIFKASDTTYYITGGYAYGRNNTGSIVYRESYIVKLDQNFDEVYELKYDNTQFYTSGALGIIETNDASLLVLGQRLMGQGTAYDMRTTMHKITPEGEVLWQRQYVANNDTNETASYGLSIKQTFDDGFIFGGWAYSSDLSTTQQMWLVKTDEFGCDDTGDFWDCATNIMYNEYVDNPSFEMYPNPARNTLFIEQESQSAKAKDIKIYDISGKFVISKSLQTSTNQSFDISMLNKGVYFVRIGKQIKKLVVE